MKQHLLGILLAVAVCFGANLPAQAQNTKDIVDRLNTSLGISLPSQYQTTVKNFVKNSKILSDKDAQTFTEQFIKDQMKASWGINKQNQLLFVWDAVYGQILNNKQLYTGEDGNQTRLNEFEKVMEKAEACGKRTGRLHERVLQGRERKCGWKRLAGCSSKRPEKRSCHECCPSECGPPSPANPKRKD